MTIRNIFSPFLILSMSIESPDILYHKFDKNETTLWTFIHKALWCLQSLILICSHCPYKYDYNKSPLQIKKKPLSYSFSIYWLFSLKLLEEKISFFYSHRIHFSLSSYFLSFSYPLEKAIVLKIYLLACYKPNYKIKKIIYNTYTKYYRKTHKHKTAFHHQINKSKKLVNRPYNK